MRKLVGDPALRGFRGVALRQNRISKLMHFFLPLRRDRVYPCPKIRTDSHKGCPYVYSAFPLKGEFAGLNALLYVCQIVRVGESDAIRPAP